MFMNICNELLGLGDLLSQFGNLIWISSPYRMNWFCQGTAYRIANCVWVLLCVCKLSYRPEFLL